MRVGLLGGSFDPVHRGHMALARAALAQLRLDCVYLVPARLSPFKRQTPPAPASRRVEALRLLVRRTPKIKVALWELRRPGPSYTIDTLTRYHRRHPSHEIVLVMGTDALGGFPRWRRARAIARIASVAVGRRPGAPMPRVPSFLSGRVTVLKGRFPAISSTQLRARR